MDKEAQENFIPEKVSFSDFVTPLLKNIPFLNIQEQITPQNSYAQVYFPKNFNKRFEVPDPTIFETDLDKLEALYPQTPLLDALEKSFDQYTFNDEEGIFKYPFDMPNYWDILPFAPIRKLTRPLAQYSEIYSRPHNQNPEFLSQEFNQKLNELTNTDISFGNSTKLLLNGEFYDEILSNLRKAKKFIFASQMFLTGDYTQTPMYELIEQKIKEGVLVCFILDRVFAIKYNKAYKRLEKLGVKMFYLRNGLKFKGRTIYHTKFWSFDNELALVFGANLLDAQINSNGFNGGYRDTGVKITGPAVRDLTALFIEIASNFDKKAPKILSSIKEETQKIILQEKEDKKRGIENAPQKGMMRVVFQGEYNGQDNIAKLYRKLIENARHNIFITNVRLTEKLDYEEDKVTSELSDLMHKKAKNDNVRVDVLTNNWLTATHVKSVNYTDGGFFTWLYKRFVKREDMRVVATATRKLYRQDYTENYKVWHYFQFIHSKLFSVDNTIHLIGSFNLNKLSIDSSYELMVVCYDELLADEVPKTIVRDLMNSVPILRGKD